MSPSDDQQPAGAFITSVSFPTTLPDVVAMGRKNQRRLGWYSDLENLLKRNVIVEWTAPPWALIGDVAFFYCTKRAEGLATKRYDEARNAARPNRRLVAMLKRAKEDYKKHAGTIFACAQVVAPTAHLGAVEGHFNSRNFAALGAIHHFTSGLKLEQFNTYVKISRRTITPLYGPQFSGIRQALTVSNRIPDYLAAADPDAPGLRGVTEATWDQIVTRPVLRFRYEDQARVYWLDYLLHALKDPDTQLFEECRCIHPQSREAPGFADYCLRIGGQWVPVEAKLNILAERDIVGQIRKYLGATGFTPTKGAQVGKLIPEPTAALCLIADQAGLYAADADGFIDCGPEQPLWRREELTRHTVGAVRDWVQHRPAAR